MSDNERLQTEAIHAAGALRGRSILSSADLSSDETRQVIAVAAQLKQHPVPKTAPLFRQGLALVFEKPSMRTRVTFELGMVHFGGHPVYLAQSDIGLGVRETVPDVARNLSRWVQGIAARTFAHSTVVELARCASIPVINALSDWEHPCQALADFQTITERTGTAAGFTLAWIGDGNNVCHSIMLAGARLGAHVRVATPIGYEPDADVVRQARQYAAVTGGSIELTHDPREAARGADGLYTDVWTSMGQEAEGQERMKAFEGFQVNRALLEEAAPDAIVLHDQPAHRGEEITDEMMDGPQSAVLDQAENRLHAQKALLLMLMGSPGSAA